MAKCSMYKKYIMGHIAVALKSTFFVIIPQNYIEQNITVPLHYIYQFPPTESRYLIC